MTDTTDEMSTLPPVETTKPNANNESSHNNNLLCDDSLFAFHSTLISSDQ